MSIKTIQIFKDIGKYHAIPKYVQEGVDETTYQIILRVYNAL